MADEIRLDKGLSPAKSLFLGNVVEQNLFPFPKLAGEEAETLKLVLDSIDKLLAGREEEFRVADKEGRFSDGYIESLKELGLFGIIIPEEYGGIGLSSSSYSRIVQQSSRYDGSTSLTIGAHSSIGMRGLLLFGNEDQKQRYLPRLASGELIAAFCLTEPGSGSDAASIQTRAEKQPDGSWLLNGSKIWITNGNFAGFYTVFAKTDSEAGKLSAFMVEREWDGVSTGPEEQKMGIKASSTCTVTLANVRVPPENLLGEEGMGFKIAMEILNNGRTGLGGGCVGAMKRAIQAAVEFASERKQFGKHIHEFGLIKEKIAQMTIDCFAAESLVAMVGHYIDNKVEDFSLEAAMSKIFTTEALWRTANEALQIAGGSGYMQEYPFERLVRDSRINMIFEGTNEILRLYIGLSGMRAAGEYLKEIQTSVGNIFNDPIKGFGVLSGYAQKKISQLTPMGRDKIMFIHPALSEEREMIEEYTLRLARSTESILRRYGKGIIGRQFETKRLAEVATDLVVSLSVCSRVTSLVEASGAEASHQEISIARTFCRQAKRRMNQNLRRLDKNEDDMMRGLSEYIVERGRYPWDTL